MSHVYWSWFVFDRALLQVTLRRLSQALRSTDLEEVAKRSQDELGLGLEALEVGSAESITSNLEVQILARLIWLRGIGFDFFARDQTLLFLSCVRMDYFLVFLSLPDAKDGHAVRENDAEHRTPNKRAPASLLVAASYRRTKKKDYN